MGDSISVANHPDQAPGVPATDDDQAVRRVLAGEADAFAGLVRAHEYFLRTWLAARCPPGVDGDEIAHRAFIKAYQIIDGWTLGSSFRAWLAAIARNLLLAECKSARSRSEGARRYVDVLVARAREQELAAEPAEVDDRRAGALRACLELLPASGRQLLHQHYAEGQALKDLAGATGRSTGAIKKHLFLLRRKLHDCVRQRLATGGAS